MNPCSNTRARPGINSGNTQELTPTHTHTHFLLLPAHPPPSPNIQLLGPAGRPLPGDSLPPSLEEGTAHQLPSTSAPAAPEFVCQAAGPLGRQPRSLSSGRSQEWLNQLSGELCISKISIKGNPGLLARGGQAQLPGQEPHTLVGLGGTWEGESWGRQAAGKQRRRIQSCKGVPGGGECPGAAGGQGQAGGGGRCPGGGRPRRPLVLTHHPPGLSQALCTCS